MFLFWHLLTCHSLFDIRNMAYATEELWFPEWEFGGIPYEVPESFEKFNPINLVKNWTTPTLFIHGEKDYRISYTESIAAFTALQRKKIPSQLLLFPEENHWVLKPANSVLWHQTVFEWLNRFLSK